MLYMYRSGTVMVPGDIAVKPALAEDHRKIYVILQSLLEYETRTSSLCFGRTDSSLDYYSVQPP